MVILDGLFEMGIVSWMLCFEKVSFRRIRRSCDYCDCP
jgi:hypothetical protein